MTSEELDEMSNTTLQDFPLATPDTLTKEYLEELFVELDYNGNSDPECAHILESTAMHCFIENVVANKYTLEEARAMGVLLLRIIDLPFPRWFA